MVAILSLMPITFAFREHGTSLHEGQRSGAGTRVETEPTHQHQTAIFELIMGGVAAQAIRTLASMSVAEHLAAGPLTAAEIARRESTDPGMTYRLLRAAAALGIVQYDTAQRTFAQTPLLAVLHGESPFSLKTYALAPGHPSFWLPAAYLPETVAKGVNHVVEALGSPLFEYLAQHEQEARQFSAAMSELSLPVIREAVQVIEAPAGLAVDVGGGDGAFVCELTERNAGLQGLVLDLPHAVPAAAAHASRRGLGDRVIATAGDFFDTVPPADVYLLKFVLHDWDDDSCLTILRNIRTAMRPGGRLFVVEMTLSPSDPSPVAALLDLSMLMCSTGRERELPEFEHLLTDADLRVQRVVPLVTPYQVIEAVAP